MNVEYRPTIAADLALAGDTVLPHRIQAISVVIDGDLKGFGGIGFRPDGTVIAFVHAAPDARRYPIAFHRAGLKTMQMIESMGLRSVVAQAQPGNPAARPWLERLGFERRIVADHEIYVWTRKVKRRA